MEHPFMCAHPINQIKREIDRMYSCDQCESIFQSYAELTRHRIIEQRREYELFYHHLRVAKLWRRYHKIIWEVNRPWIP